MTEKKPTGPTREDKTGRQAKNEARQKEQREKEEEERKKREEEEEAKRAERRRKEEERRAKARADREARTGGRGRGGRCHSSGRGNARGGGSTRGCALQMAHSVVVEGETTVNEATQLLHELVSWLDQAAIQASDAISLHLSNIGVDHSAHARFTFVHEDDNAHPYLVEADSVTGLDRSLI